MIIWRLAGVVGVDPGPFTWRQLDIMAEGVMRQQWAQTSLIATLLFNAHRGKDVEPLEPKDFNPFTRKPAGKAAKVPISSLRGMFKGIAHGA